MKIGMTIKEIHDEYPDVSRKLIQNAAREELAPQGMARKVGSGKRGVWLIESDVVPSLIEDMRKRKPGAQPRIPTDLERDLVDRTYRVHGSVASVANCFGIHWRRAKAWLIDLYGPDEETWPAHQHPV